MRNKGWASHYRKLHDHWISKIEPYCAGYAWSYLYVHANHRDGDVEFNDQVVIVLRGQLLTSIKKLAATWQWKYKRTSNFLKKLEKAGMIRQNRTSKYTLITVVNYDKYQRNNRNKENRGKSKANQRQTNNKGNNLNKHPLMDA